MTRKASVAGICYFVEWYSGKNTVQRCVQLIFSSGDKKLLELKA